MKQNKFLQQLQKKENYIKLMPNQINYSAETILANNLERIKDTSQPILQPLGDVWGVKNTTMKKDNSISQWQMENDSTIPALLSLFMILILSLSIAWFLSVILPMLIVPELK